MKENQLGFYLWHMKIHINHFINLPFFHSQKKSTHQNWKEKALCQKKYLQQDRGLFFSWRADMLGQKPGCLSALGKPELPKQEEKRWLYSHPSRHEAPTRAPGPPSPQACPSPPFSCQSDQWFCQSPLESKTGFTGGRCLTSGMKKIKESFK